ncbi:uncharacterized protein A4U43_C08F27160 [Asparagus officinalis]|nr:uncharacterized protein A4U43_C08F27160 [Asparagus officinalis]
MGSLCSPPPSPLSPENATGISHIYAPFCRRGASSWLESYNPSDNVWSHVGEIPGIPENHSLKDFALVSLGDSVYVVGGRLCLKESETVDDSSTEVELSVRPDVLRYTVSTGEWSTCAPLTIPRFDFACAACDGKIYVAGATILVLSRGRGTAAAEAYDPAQRPVGTVAEHERVEVQVRWSHLQGRILRRRRVRRST